jgi:peptide/nickel transport system substrate-binding protein
MPALNEDLRFPLAAGFIPAMLVSLLVLGGCGGGSGGTARGGQTIIGEAVDLDKPLPLVAESNLDNVIVGLIYPTLLTGEWVDGELVYVTAEESPLALARSYEYFGADSASIRFHLRTDMLWSDGRPVTAHDAAWTTEAQGVPELASPRMDFNREIRGLEVEDDSTFVVHFTRRYPEMLFHLSAGGIAPRHPYEGTSLADLRSHPAVTNPVGTLVTSGPFRIAQWSRGQQLVLERDPNFRPAPNIDRIVFRVLPEETTRLIELQTGRIDRVLIPFTFIDEANRSPDLRIEAQEKRSYEYIAYNPLAHDFFADPEVRRALGLAIDTRALISALQIDDFAVPAGGPYPPIFRRLYDPEGQAPLPFDTTEARRILASKGWTPGPNGILTRNGVPFRFTLMTNGDNRRRVDIAQIVERMWRRIGIEVRIQTLEFNTSIERANGRNFEAFLGGWGVGLSPDLHSLWGDPDNRFNFVGYDNPEVQRLIAEALAQTSPEAAAPFWRQAASTISADQPYTWLYYIDRPHAIRNRLQGTLINVAGEYLESWNWYVQE